MRVMLTLRGSPGNVAPNFARTFNHYACMTFHGSPVNPRHSSTGREVTISPRTAPDPGAEWDQFISRLACAARAGEYTRGASSKELAACAAAPMAPMTRLLAQALLIRLERTADGGPVSLSMLEQHAALPEQAVRLLMTSIGRSGEPRVRVLLDRVAS